MSKLVPWLAIFLGGFALFLVGKYFQYKEGKQRARKRPAMRAHANSRPLASEALQDGIFADNKLGAYAHSQSEGQHEQREVGFGASQQALRH